MPHIQPNQRARAKEQSQKRWVTDSTQPPHKLQERSTLFANRDKDSLVGSRLDANFHKNIFNLSWMRSFQFFPIKGDWCNAGSKGATTLYMDLTGNSPESNFNHIHLSSWSHPHLGIFWMAFIDSSLKRSWSLLTSQLLLFGDIRSATERLRKASNESHDNGEKDGKSGTQGSFQTN